MSMANQEGDLEIGAGRETFDTLQHAVRNAISCLDSIAARGELAQGGEQSGNWAHVVDALAWLKKAQTETWPQKS